MKDLKLIALALALSISTVSFAAPINEDPKSELRQQIIEMLGKTTDKLADTKLEAEIIFTVNVKSEIVIISINSKNSNVELESFVKSKLNYKKVTVNDLNEGKTYYMPLTIVNK